MTVITPSRSFLNARPPLAERTPHRGVAVMGLCLLSTWLAAADFGSRNATQWGPFQEWTTQASVSGNPYDLVSWAHFTHADSGETRKSLLFYDGGTTFRWRFTAPRTGRWTFRTASPVAALNGHTGVVNVTAQTNPHMRGFIAPGGESASRQNKWTWSGTGEAFTPQVVMYVAAEGSKFFSLTANQLRADAEEFFVGHGFNGFHVPVMLPEVWMTAASGNPNPRRETFAKLEMIIAETYAAGGVVQLWIWGDENRQWTPNRFDGGQNGPVDQRLQRYLAARLGPMPGWIPSYGFDLWEWTVAADLDRWRNTIRAHTDLPLLFGGRGAMNRLDQISEHMGYSSYEWHRPLYAQFVDHLEARPGKPSFSEDRFRITGRDSSKEYTPTLTRRGMWHAVMAGGVGQIFGNLTNGGSHADGSAPYPNKGELRTHARFWKGRFLVNLVRANQLTGDADTRVLRNGDRLVFYRENANRISIDLRGIGGTRRAIAVNAASSSYTEIDLGSLSASNHTITLPSSSDWAIAVGDFGGSSGGGIVPAAPTNLVATVASSSRIDLRWNDNATNEDGFRIERKTGSSGSWSQIANVGTGVTSYSDGSLSAATTATYRIRAFNAHGTSASTNEVIATTPGGSSSGTIQINFQPANAPTVNGWLVDSGAIFGDRGNDRHYGWSASTLDTRDRNRIDDQLGDTLNHMQRSGRPQWEIAVPNGDYRVSVLCGDASFIDQINHLMIETVAVRDPDGFDTFDRYDTIPVTVNDGRLTIQAAADAQNAKICWVRIEALDGDSNEDDDSGTLIHSVSVSNGKTYELDTLVTGVAIYIDRSFTVTQIPSYLVGAEFVRTANNDKNSSGTSFLTLQLGAPATLYVAFDARSATPPSWLAAWELVERNALGTTDVGRDLYRRDVAAGSVELGGNTPSDAGSMYQVIAVPRLAGNG